MGPAPLPCASTSQYISPLPLLSVIPNLSLLQSPLQGVAKPRSLNLNPQSDSLGVGEGESEILHFQHVPRQC